MAALALAGIHTAWAVMLPSWLYCIGHGVHQPCGQTGAIGPFPDKAGTAASLSGFWMMAVAFAVGLFLGQTGGDTVYPMTLGFATLALALCAVAWTLVQRHGEPAALAVPAGARPA
jgi:DHA1 family bicyclomycin/chloramphenicol resistance-like MFS transporter